MLRRSVIISLAALLAAPAAVAQQFPGNTWAPQSNDQRGGGEVPFEQIKRELERRHGGQMLQSNRRGNMHVITWLDRNDNRLEIRVDAGSGRIISERGNRG